MGTGRPVLGAGHRTRPARPFVRLSGAARSRALLRERRKRPGCAPAPARPRGAPHLPGRERAPGPPQPGPGARRAFVRRFVRGRFSQGVCDWCQRLGPPGLTGGFEPGTRGAVSRASASSFPCAHPGPRFGNSGPSWSSLPGTQASCSQREPTPPDGVGRALCAASGNWFGSVLALGRVR